MDRQALKELLEFYAESGVDAAIGDEAVDRYSEPKAQAAPPLAPAPAQPEPMVPAARRPSPPPIATQESDDPVQGLAHAEALAAGASTLEELRAALDGFDGCALKKTARQLVFADGNPDASIMLIGEAPGRDEDAQGLPFVGRSGQLLYKMLAAIGLDRTKVYIGNVIYWRPPGNRTPTPDERALCEPFIRRQIALVQPKVMMTLGGSALSTLFEGRTGIMKTRGQLLTYAQDGLSIPTIPTLHPAGLLRQPLNKRLAWRDLLLLDELAREHGAR
ncbi:MAG: uracil-DNA glycosylase family protein [Cohaesibacteraceae bacterium]